MQHLIDSVFTDVLSMLVELGYIDLDELYVDGTKIEANANKHSGVWAKNTDRYKGKVQERIGVLLEELKAMQKAEDEKYGTKDLAEVGQGKDVSVTLSSDEIQSSLQGVTTKPSKSQNPGQSSTTDQGTSQWLKE